jgi:hypothetical protein
MKKITIVSNQRSEYQFNLTSTGVALTSGNVFFLIKVAEGVYTRIDCDNVVGQTWQLNVPENTLKDGSYKYTVCVIVDHYHFDAYSGEVDVVSEQSFSVEPDQSSEHSEEQDVKKDDDTPTKVQTGKRNSKKTKDDQTKTNEDVSSVDAEVITNDPVNNFIKTHITSDPIFNFNILTPTNLKDNGKAEKHVRDALKKLKGKL